MTETRKQRQVIPFFRNLEAETDTTMLKRIPLIFAAVSLLLSCSGTQTLEQAFLTPPDDAKPIMIWQWMDGLVTKEGITQDLEAYQKAGIGGVQQFLVGSETQILVKDTANAIGTDNWRELMKHAISECARLGLSFGTHNCPGWSSSAFPTVKPELSMQKLVWTETPVRGTGRSVKTTLPRPEVDPKWDYYEDIAVLAARPGKDGVLEEVVVVPAGIGADGTLEWAVPQGKWVLYRFGHTTNGKTNYATAPEGGVGLECDKMSREAVKAFWELYPQQIIDIAGEETGRTFTRFEVDSYEAGGQEWTREFPKEFSARKGYDILPWLPALVGQTVRSKEESAKVVGDWTATVKDLFAEYYYGTLSELAHANGLELLVEPYGTGRAQPFNPIDTDLVISKIDPSDPVAAEFWTQPLTWGWPEVPMVVAAARRGGRQTVWAEGFTCIPGFAWKDDPSGLKTVGDKAFCLGINAFMFHAGAQNPWTQVKPGMTFGQWGTQWTPGQTWWKDGADKLFTYFTRCQALLRRGRFVDDYTSKEPTLLTDNARVQWIHRIDDDGTEYWFVANTADDPVTATLSFSLQGKVPETWDPKTVDIREAASWTVQDGKTVILETLEPRGSRFIVFRKAASGTGPGLEDRSPKFAAVATVGGPWTVSFPEGWGAPASVTLDKLSSWTESEDDGVKYFSGTATYTATFTLDQLDRKAGYALDLGKVKNLAVVRVNGRDAGTLWTPPFLADITGLLRKGKNTLEIDVTNLWVNRMIGDEFEPADIEWAPGARGGIGRQMLKVPEWLEKGLPRPSAGRKTVVIYRSFTQNDPLVESGLIGPVEILCTSARQY